MTIALATGNLMLIVWVRLAQTASAQRHARRLEGTMQDARTALKEAEAQKKEAEAARARADAALRAGANVSEATRLAGYETAEAFATAYRNWSGHSPSQTRRSAPRT